LTECMPCGTSLYLLNNCLGHLQWNGFSHPKVHVLSSLSFSSSYCHIPLTVANLLEWPPWCMFSRNSSATTTSENYILWLRLSTGWTHLWSQDLKPAWMLCHYLQDFIFWHLTCLHESIPSESNSRRLDTCPGGTVD
jgi:hypothetical protein